MPSSTPVASPINTTPIESSSRFKATPTKPPGNSNNSEAITSSRPTTLATPSAIVRTWPTKSSFTSFSQPLRLSCNDFVISFGSKDKSLISYLPPNTDLTSESRVETRPSKVRSPTLTLNPPNTSSSICILSSTFLPNFFFNTFFILF